MWAHENGPTDHYTALFRTAQARYGAPHPLRGLGVEAAQLGFGGVSDLLHAVVGEVAHN